ncbi:MAG: PilZ domain-containing protein [Candidatus Omnitrophica bacterium]|nr:PilZ domain-containing protein [Candidatus Omnitrophota bacterium]
MKERRKLMRIAADLQAEYWAKGPSMEAGQARIRDFSREGLGALFPRPVRRGEHVDLTMHVPGDNIPIFATAEVAWSDEKAAEEKTGAGLRFVLIKPLDLARLLEFVYSGWLGKAGKKV